MSRFASRFVELVRDPIRTPGEIAAELGISLASFYRYEKELAFPTLKVGFGLTSRLPFRRALATALTPHQRQELRILREVAQRLDARIKLLPVELGEQPLKVLRKGEVDLVMASCSWTPRRSKSLYFSEPYLLDEKPHGFLVGLKGLTIRPRAPGTKPRLSAVPDSIHWDFADRHLRGEFELVAHANYHASLYALSRGSVEAVLTHPMVLTAFSDLSGLFEIKSPKFDYGSFTGFVFNSESDAWRPEIDRALDELFDSGRLQELQRLPVKR